MKQFKIKTLFFSAVVLLLTSCLKKENSANIDVESPGSSIVTLGFIENGSGSTINSGLQYFAGGALTYPADHESDTANFMATIAGPTTPANDVNITIGIKNDAVLDNYKSDSIQYELMPDSLYSIVTPTATVKAGTRTIPLRIVFYPAKIDPTKSYMLPIVVTDAGGMTVSSNFGIVYFHVIGNPIAGGYLWDFYRYNNQDGSGAPATTWVGDPAVFAPVNPTNVKVPTGYYTTPNYLISFVNNNGVLSNFKAVIAPDEIKAAFTDNGVNVILGPTINVNAAQTRFEIKYTVYNGSAYRNITDIFYK